MAGLIGTATTEKDGLMSVKFYLTGYRRMLTLSSPNHNKLVEIGRVNNTPYYRAFLKVEGYYESKPIMCTININVHPSSIDVILKEILPCPAEIKFYKKITDDKISVYAMSTMSSGNTSQISVTHYSSNLSPDIGTVYDLDDTYTEI